MKARTSIALKLFAGLALLSVLFLVVDRAALRDVMGQVNRWILFSLPVFYVHSAVKALRWDAAPTTSRR